MTIGKLIVLIIVAMVAMVFYLNWDLTKDPQSVAGATIVVITWLVGILTLALSLLILIKVIINTWDKKLPFIR